MPSIKKRFVLLYMSGYFVCKYVYVPYHAWCPQRSEEGVGAPGTITDDCELPYQCWDSNLAPLEKLPVILTSRVTFLAQ